MRSLREHFIDDCDMREDHVEHGGGDMMLEGEKCPVCGDEMVHGVCPHCGDEPPMDEVAPPGWEGTVKAMKKHKDIKNPWALAWSMKNKGQHHHESVLRSIIDQVVKETIEEECEEEDITADDEKMRDKNRLSGASYWSMPTRPPGTKTIWRK